MATGDFDYLRAAAAETLSVPLFSNLPTPVQNEVDALINEAYRGCFLRPDGKRARWGEQNLTFQFKAPVQFTFVATQGAVSMGSVTGLVLEAQFAGSVMNTDGGFFRYAGKTSPGNLDVMAEPYTGTTGTVNATFYYNSYVLPVETIDVCGDPYIMGNGVLSPISSNEQFVKARARYSDLPMDEWRSNSWGWSWGWGSWMTWFTEYFYGMPLWYWVDDSNLAVDGSFGAVRPRFCLYPLPNQGPRNVSLRGNILPALMTTGSDMPRLKTSAIIDTLLPIIRSKVANGRRYNGDNRAILSEQAQEATLKLDALDSTQRKKPARAQVKCSW